MCKIEGKHEKNVRWGAGGGRTDAKKEGRRRLWPRAGLG